MQEYTISDAAKYLETTEEFVKLLIDNAQFCVCDGKIQFSELKSFKEAADNLEKHLFGDEFNFKVSEEVLGNN